MTDGKQTRLEKAQLELARSIARTLVKAVCRCGHVHADHTALAPRTRVGVCAPPCNCRRFQIAPLVVYLERELGMVAVRVLRRRGIPLGADVVRRAQNRNWRRDTAT